jgi:hypothetical protein
VPIMRSRGPSVVPRTSVFVPQGSRRYRPAVTGRERDWLRRQIDAARRLRVAYLEEHGRPPSARPCPVCLVGELNGNPRQRYCSPRCKNRARKRRNHEALLAEVRARTCEVCGEPLATRVSQRARARATARGAARTRALAAGIERGCSQPAELRDRPRVEVVLVELRVEDEQVVLRRVPDPERDRPGERALVGLPEARRSSSSRSARVSTCNGVRPRSARYGRAFSARPTRRRLRAACLQRFEQNTARRSGRG